MHPISVLVSILVIVIIVIINSGSATAAAKGDGRSQDGVDQDAKNRLMATCKQKANKCKGQTVAYSTTRRTIKSILVNDLRHRQPNISFSAASRKAESQLLNVYGLKIKLHSKFGLVNIDPADDGLWQGDVILTEEQIESISKSLDNPREPSTSPENRSASVYFEKNPRSRWQMPIRYWTSNAFSNSEKATIDDALSTLASSSGCIQFAKDSNRAGSGSQMQFVKPGTGCYGYSYVGHVGINPVNIATTGWCKGDILKGLVMHEVIHALGGDHEQCRRDRDHYIQILWDNIDPQQWSAYKMAQSSTSYGVPYDYKSVMHYQQGTFAKSANLPTMRPKVNTQLGGNFLTSGDSLQLNRMYCRPANCVDKHQDCGTWAVFKYCDDAKWGQWMKGNCAKSCGGC